MQSLVPDTLATQADQPVILFLNGEYWGIYFLNETLDYYLVNQNKDSVCNRHYFLSHIHQQLKRYLRGLKANGIVEEKWYI